MTEPDGQFDCRKEVKVLITRGGKITGKKKKEQKQRTDAPTEGRKYINQGNSVTC